MSSLLIFLVFSFVCISIIFGLCMWVVYYVVSADDMDYRRQLLDDFAKAMEVEIAKERQCAREFALSGRSGGQLLREVRETDTSRTPLWAEMCQHPQRPEHTKIKGA